MPKKKNKKARKEGVSFESNGKVEFLEQKYIDALVELGLLQRVGDGSADEETKQQDAKEEIR